MTDLTDWLPEAVEPEPRAIRPALSSIVLGVVALILSFVPGGNLVAVIPAVLAVVMGIGGLRDHVAHEWECRLGIILGPLATVISVLTLIGIVRF